MAGVNDKNITLEDARIVFRNFSGKEGQYNREGDRNFSVVLDDEMADDLEKDGWNVKRKPPREEGDENFNHLSVTVSFKGRPPRLVLISYGGGETPRRTTLDEETCDILDWADMKTVDMIIRPYEWAVNGKTGTKAYLHAIYVTINEDLLERKYAGVPEIASRSHQLTLTENVLDVEVISDTED
jgi:hypothetical protein